MQYANGGRKWLNTMRYALVQGNFWMSYCVIFSFVSFYLLRKGFTNTQIGIVIAVASGFAALLQPIMGEALDQYERLTLHKATIALCIVILGAALCLFLLKLHEWVIAVLYGMMLTVLQILVPIINSLGMYYINRKVTLNFGIARGGGSLFYAIASVVVGKLIERYDESLLPLLIIGATLIFSLSVITFRFHTVEEVTNEKVNSTISRRETSFYKRYPRFMLLVGAFIFIFICHNMLSNFILQMVQYHGAGSKALGIIGGIAAASELPTMFLFGCYMRKMTSDKLLKISGAFFALKALGSFLATNLWVLYGVQGLQMFGFALFAVASVYYVNEVIDEKDRVKGQAYVTMTMSVGTVLGSFLGGYLIDHTNVPGMLLAATLAGGIGAIGVFFFTEPVKKEKICDNKIVVCKE